MKKILVRVAAAIGGLIVLVVLAVVVKFFVLSPKYRPAPDVKAPTSPEAIARGKYLFTHVAGCAPCHSKIDETKAGEQYVEGFLGAGRDFGEQPGQPAHFRSRNLTPDKETGLGSWTDGEILRAMREGVSRDNRPLFPQMPYLVFRETLSDDDALAIIAYVRTLAPVKNDPGYTDVHFPVSIFFRAAPAPLEKSPPPAPPVSDKMARGQWLLKTALCAECHDTYNERHEALPGMAYAGGFKFPVPGGKYAIAPNITSDKATGIGAYSDDDLKRVFNEGKGKDGRTLYVMPWYYFKGMTDEDKDALLMALRAIPPVSHAVPPSKTQ